VNGGGEKDRGQVVANLWTGAGSDCFGFGHCFGVEDVCSFGVFWFGVWRVGDFVEWRTRLKERRGYENTDLWWHLGVFTWRYWCLSVAIS